MSDIYEEIKAERARQDAQWGGPEHDDRHDSDDWRRYRERFEEKADGAASSVMRSNLVKIAALAVAQIESLDRRSHV